MDDTETLVTNTVLHTEVHSSSRKLWIFAPKYLSMQFFVYLHLYHFHICQINDCKSVNISCYVIITEFENHLQKSIWFFTLPKLEFFTFFADCSFFQYLNFRAKNAKSSPIVLHFECKFEKQVLNETFLSDFHASQSV